jgi:cytochrome c553
VLRAYKKGERKSKEMAVMTEGLDDALIEGLAKYYARQKGRGIAYLVLPPPK